IIDGKLIITHDTGIINTYTESDLLRLLAAAIEREQEADNQVEYVRDLLNSLTQQTAKKVGIVKRFTALIKGKRYV
ncbi:hypothetical protein LCGC14_2791200, partial [marine sediment metagenome]